MERGVRGREVGGGGGSRRALPEERKRHGYDNFNFNFASFGAMENGACAAERPLPDYAIRRIETGRFSDEGVLWAVRLAVAE